MTRHAQALRLEDLGADREAAHSKVERARQAWESAQDDYSGADLVYRAALLASRTDALTVGTFLKYKRYLGARTTTYGRILGVGLMPTHETQLSYTVALCSQNGVYLKNDQGERITSRVTTLQPFEAIPDPLAQVQP